MFSQLFPAFACASSESNILSIRAEPDEASGGYKPFQSPTDVLLTCVVMLKKGLFQDVVDGARSQLLSQQSATDASEATESPPNPMTSPLGGDKVVQSFISPEVRYSGGISIPPSRPPNPWNPKYVTPIYLDEPGPFEEPPVERDEWQRTGRRADAGRRRFSAYSSYCNRDGPRLVEGMHPSRSALRSLPSNPVKTVAAAGLEARFGMEPPLAVGCAADTLECRPHGHLRVEYPDGSSRMVRGAFYPDRRPFSGLRHVVPPTAAAMMEARGAPSSARATPASNTIPQFERRTETPAAEEALMDDIVTEFVHEKR